MKIKTAELKGTALDWAVAQCENRKDKYWMNDGVWGVYSPSTNWALGGPIIEREGIEVTLYTWAMPDLPNEWVAKYVYWEHEMRGATYIEAAMRCYVASKLGDEVEIPEELV